MAEGPPLPSARDTRNRLRRKAEAEQLAIRAVLDAARPLTEVRTPTQLAGLSLDDLATLRQAFEALDSVQ